MNELNITTYAIFSAVVIFVLWSIVVNVSTKNETKVKPRPKIKALKLFKGNNGLSERRVRELYNIKEK